MKEKHGKYFTVILIPEDDLRPCTCPGADDRGHVLREKLYAAVGPSGAQPDLINILYSKYLGPKSSIILLEVMDQLIVVGISGQQMTTLAHIDDPLFVEKIKARQSKQNISSPQDKISKLLKLAGFPAGKKTDGAGK